MSQTPPSLSSIPAAFPPPGEVSDFNGPSRAPALIGTCITITAVMATVVMMRLYSRMRYTKHFASDDYTCVAAAFGSIGFTVVTIMSTTAGFGRHLWNYPITIFTLSYFQRIYAVQGMYSPLILLVKISLFLLYLRIFSHIKRTRYLIYLGIGINALFYIISFALILYMCGPGPGINLIEAFNTYRCKIEARTLGTVQASFNIASDIYLLAIPIPVISNLQLSRKKKIGVGAIFMTGSLAAICSILNLYYRVLNGGTMDFTWAIPPVYITSVVEVNIGIMCGCFPALPPIFRSVRTVIGSSKLSSRIFKWRRLSSDDSRTKKSSKNGGAGDKAGLTLGSKVKGDGHFWTMKSFFAKEEETDSSMGSRGSESEADGDDGTSRQTTLRGSQRDDVEMGLPYDGYVREK